MIRLSVNVNKIATLRNSRTAQTGPCERGIPSVVTASEVCVRTGAMGITVHPRPDARHITFTDVREVAAKLAPMRDEVELNIEGDPRSDLVDLVQEVKPHQFTIVPVRPGELTSQAGWPVDTPVDPLRALVEKMHAIGVRVSMFVEPDSQAIDWAASLGADRVELYTEPFAAAFAQDPAKGREVFQTYVAAAEHAHGRGLGINAGHDLDLHNLEVFRELPHLDEVSIGHAIMAQAIFDGLDNVVRAYLGVLGQA